MKRATELPVGSIPSYKYGIDAYDSTKLGLGTAMVQSNGPGLNDKWFGPIPLGLARPVEYSTPFAVAFPWAMQWSPTQDWAFYIENTAASPTRRLLMTTLDRTTGGLNIFGYITIVFPTATNHTPRGLRMDYSTYSNGTVQTTGTTVTGTGTSWVSDRLAVGNRIGFGSTNPNEISIWYEIGSISSNTSITLTAAPDTLPANTPYVIEDLRAIILTTNLTLTNGGLFVVKGLRVEMFTPTGTTVPAATTVDNVRACYWLADAATQTNTIGGGMGVETPVSRQSQFFWVTNGTTNLTLYKYNIREALTPAAGKSTNGFVLQTGLSGVLVGVAGQFNNGRCANTSHGPGTGVMCFYFTTTTRIYRTVPLSTITSGTTSWIADLASEVPPGLIYTQAASGALSSMEYISSADKFIVTINSTAPFRDYVTQYRTDAGQWDRVFGCDIKQSDISTVDATTTPVFSRSASSAWSVWSEGNIAYFCGLAVSSAACRIYTVPIGADWEYADATKCYIVTPKLMTPSASQYSKVNNQNIQVIGGSSGTNLGMNTEPFRVKYRTSGIDDDSGSWIQLDSNLDISGVLGAAAIQLRYEFRTIGTTCVPARIADIGVTYEDLSTDGHYQLSVAKSNLTTKKFAWLFSRNFSNPVPALRVRIYDVDTDALLCDDSTVSPTGLFEASTNDGVSWSAWTNADRSNLVTYLRYTPSSLADNVKVRPVLTLN